MTQIDLASYNMYDSLITLIESININLYSGIRNLVAPLSQTSFKTEKDTNTAILSLELKLGDMAIRNNENVRWSG